MITFEFFAPEIRLQAYTVADPVIELYVRNAIIEFCEKTRCWTKLVQEYVFKGDARVDITDFDETQEEVEAVLAGWLDQQPLRTPPLGFVNYSRFGGFSFTGEAEGAPAFMFELPYDADSNSIGVWPVPDKQYNSRLTFKIALKPTQEATVFPDLFKQHRQAIIAGALSEIQALPGKPFSNQQAAGFNMTKWARATLDERVAQNIGSKVTGGARIQPVGFGPTRRRFGSF